MGGSKTIGFGVDELNATSPDGRTVATGVRGGSSIELYESKTGRKLASQSLISGRVVGPMDEQEELMSLTTDAGRQLFCARVSFVVDHMYVCTESRLFTYDRLEPAGIERD